MTFPATTPFAVSRSVFVESHGDRPKVKNVAILITSTDGSFGNDNDLVEKNGLRFVNETNTHFVVIGPYVERSQVLKRLSNNNYLIVKRDFSDIKNKSLQVLSSIEDGSNNTIK